MAVWARAYLTATLPVIALVSPPGRAPALEACWPGWRGQGQGLAAADTRIPLEWNETKNVLWKSALPGRGLSSPIVWGDRIFLTTAVEGDVVPDVQRMRHFQPDGTEFRHPDALGDDRKHGLELLALDARSGRLLWQRRLWEGVPSGARHKKGSFASPTPVTDGERVYAYFGTEGLYAYDFEGRPAWKFDPGTVATFSVGVGTSPVLYGDLVILLADEDNGDRSYIAGIDRRTGALVWRTPRKVELSWATPVVVDAAGRDELVTAGNQASIAYDPKSGRELWRVQGLASNAVATPLLGDRVVVFTTGYPSKLSMAVRPGGSGDVTGAVLWRYDKGSAYVSSPVLYDGHVYLASDRGLLTCLDAQTGAVRYEGRRLPVPATLMASPIAVDGRVLFMSQEGDTFVVKAGPEFAVERVNPLGEAIGASPAVAGNVLYIRGERHLFAIGYGPK
ncbi:MAG TPA: PQQ-binding-like beta-propeller repeat protein [Vicinamibacteria bacterium]|nr:PQQ-binding-like beta-propeller repeat protein [Vicinamibacteria bacterium]